MHIFQRSTARIQRLKAQSWWYAMIWHTSYLSVNNTVTYHRIGLQLTYTVCDSGGVLKKNAIRSRRIANNCTANRWMWNMYCNMDKFLHLAHFTLGCMSMFYTIKISSHSLFKVINLLHQKKINISYGKLTRSAYPLDTLTSRRGLHEVACLCNALVLLHNIT